VLRLTGLFNREFFEIEMPKLLAMVDHVSSLVVAKINCDGVFYPLSLRYMRF
jgi:hypothetical protein